MWLAGCFVGGFIICLVRDARNDRNEKRIDELERENADLHFEVDRADAVKRDFNEECG